MYSGPNKMEEQPGAQEDTASPCLRWWEEENNQALTLWRDAICSKDSYLLKEKLQRCHADMYRLLQKIQVLPPNLAVLPLELSVLYNMVIFHINLTSGFLEEHGEQIHKALARVLEAQNRGTDNMGRAGAWQRVLHAGYTPELSAPLHGLAALHAALWLSQDKLQDVQDLFHLLTSTEVSLHCDVINKPHKLLQLIKTWRLPDDERSILTVETTYHVRDVLYTSAAFLQGIGAMETGDYFGAVEVLQEASGSLCSSKVLAEIYTCLGCCFNKMGKPRTALQYYQRALQVYFQNLSALYQSSQVYKDMGRTDAELEALGLLYKALDGHTQEVSSTEFNFLIRTELIVKTLSLTSSLLTPTLWEVKYLIARRSLQTRRVEEAVEHYLDLLAVLQDGAHQQSLRPSPAPLPRIPEVFLETAACLLEQKRHHDVITVCEEVVSCTREVIPERLTSHTQQSGSDGKTSMAEPVNCVLWAASAHLFQGRSQGLLGNPKEAITEFTRCINLLLKIQVINSGNGDVTGDAPLGLSSKVLVLVNVLKASAFLGRGRHFLELGKHKEALLNAQLGQQVAPAWPGAAFTLLSTLWKMDRKTEAVSQWKKIQDNRTSLDEKWEAETRDFPLYLILHVKDVFPTEGPLIQELKEYLHKDGEEMQTGPDS
ncbi:Fanconi anemia group G protein [Discoglossus pictus]